MSSDVAQKDLAAALGRVPSGIFIVTAKKGDAETGMLASWLQQCSFSPPQISLAVRKDRYLNDWLVDGAPFVVNILDARQTDLLSHFGKGFAPNEPAFTGLEISRLDDGPPILNRALAYLDCRVSGRFAAGDHNLVIGTIVGGKLLNQGEPMVHIRKNGLSY
ncbi:MAG: hypothetical protein KatS3mg105_2160 [Gemmatales bacterium]|nr:MAG: hypothetical protein KatS3mg105_2160 [Gemmatales bacterium]